MVSQAPLALRFPKQAALMISAESTATEIVDTVTHLKVTQQYAVMIAPRKFREVAKVVFFVAFQNNSGSTMLGARLKVWPASTSGNPTEPDIPVISPSSGSTGADHFGSSITTRLFTKEGSKADIPAQASGEESVLTLEFDFFDPSSVEFFEAWNLPIDEDSYIAFNLAIAIDGGGSSARVGQFGATVTQAPSPQNDTVTCHPVWLPQLNNSQSGPSSFDSAKGGTCGANNASDQFRGAWRWRYNADEWDGLDSVHVLIYYGTGNNTAGQTYRFLRIDSDGQGAGSTTTLVEEFFNPGQQERGIYRTQDLLPFLEDGKDYCFDFRNEAAATASNTTPNVHAVMEIVQKDCSRSVSYIFCGCSTSRGSTGMQLADPSPETIFASSNLIDPQWFANYLDELFTIRRMVGAVIHENPSFSPKTQLLQNSDLIEDQNAPTGATVTTSVVEQVGVTGSSTPSWVYGEVDLEAGDDPINFAGQRKLLTRLADGPYAGSPPASCSEHPGFAGLKYAYAVPNTEVLDLGPLFPVGEFNPEGCAATSAGLGDPGVLVITNGSTIPKKFNPLAGVIEDAGLPVPFEGEFPTSLVVENAASSPMGGIVPGIYTYRYTLRNCCTGKESDPNPDDFTIDSAGAGASPAARHLISFAGVRIPADEQICEICLYRTVNGGAFPIMAKVGCFDPDVTSVFVDEVPDSELDFTADPLSLLNGPMPCVSLVTDYRNRLFGGGDIPQLAPAGTVSVVNGSNIVTGDGDVVWDRCLEGKFIQVQGDCRAYEIDRVLPPVAGTSPGISRLKLIEEYEGETDTGVSYIICGHKNRLFFSEPLEPECWPNINFLDVEPGDGDRLMGLASNFDSLVICKRRKTYLLRFRENPLIEVVVPQRISTDIGCIAPRSFAQVENGTVWLSDRGLAMFDGRGVGHIPASDRFNEMLIDPDNPRYVRRDGQGRVIDAVGVFYPKREQYLLLLPTVQTVRGANVMLVWDTSLDNITLYEFCQEFQSMVVAKDSDGNQRVYLGDVNGFVWMFDVGDTDGVGFPNATGTVRGTVSAAGIEQGASFLEDSEATFLTGGLPQLAALSGVQGLTPAFGVSPNESDELGMAGVCVFTRSADADLDDPWVQRTVYAATETRIYVTPGWVDETPSVGDDYMIGPIEFAAIFKPTNFGTDDMQKRNWHHVLSFVPQAVSSRVRVELLPDFANVDDEELTVTDQEGEVGAGRTFDLGFQRGRIRRPVGRRIHNFMQVRMRNFAPDEPIEVLNHVLLSNPRTQ